MNKVVSIQRKKVAVIGSGISGLSCAWHLNTMHDVTLFEKDDRLGGHSNTVSFDLDGQSVAVDTGFIVYNPVNYPNLVEFFDNLGVPNCETDMSFAISSDDGDFEYAGTDLGGLFAQKRNILRMSFWQMLYDLVRFYRESTKLSQLHDIDQISLRELLDRQGYSQSFIHKHLIPMGAAIWSTPVDKMLDYPAGSFLRFCANHGLAQFKDRPQWRTVIGGSREYVKRIEKTLEGRIQLNSHIHRILRSDKGVVIEDMHGNQAFFDEVVLACHADQALALLAEPTEEEQRLLSAFPYQRNIAYLHTDESLMPKRKKVWASWNYLCNTKNKRKDDKADQVSITYWMNQLQPLPTETPIFVSLNPLSEPDEKKIVRSFFYDHPAFNTESYENQKKLWSLQGQDHTWFCGAYFGYGFHEDGIQSGLAVAEQIANIPRPWDLEDPNSRIHVTEQRPVNTRVS